MESLLSNVYLNSPVEYFKINKIETL